MAGLSVHRLKRRVAVMHLQSSDAAAAGAAAMDTLNGANVIG